jgi:hypothetical protein
MDVRKGGESACVTYPLPQSNFSLISAESEPPNYLRRPSAS